MSGRSGAMSELIHRRASSGGRSYSVSPTRWAPLRKITDEHYPHEALECGHTLRVRSDMIGETNAYRRRCVECLYIACAAFGHPVAPDDWYERRGRCRCGRRDGLSGKTAS